MDPEPSAVLFKFSENHLSLGIFVLIVMLICAALISAAETAFFSLSEKDLKKMAKDNSSKADFISQLLESPKKLAASLVIASVLAKIAFTLLFFLLTFSYFLSIFVWTFAVVLELIIIVFILVLLSEILPKYLAARNNIRFANFLIYPIYLIDKVLSPVSIPLRSASIFLIGKTDRQKSDSLVGQIPQSVTDDPSEITTNEEQKILEGIISFGNTDTRQVMTPRIDVFALDVMETFAEVYPKIIESGYSRIPVYRDNIDQIEGVLFVKDLLPYIGKADCNWQSVIREPFFVPESKKLEKLLTDFQGRKSHLAIVVDEYGGTCGVISLEDIIEEIVGDISDESDDDEINYKQLDDNNFVFDGKIGLKDFYRILDVDEALFETLKGDAETLAGFILEIHGNFPKKGEKIHFGELYFTIEQLDRKRIKQIKVTLE